MNDSKLVFLLTHPNILLEKANKFDFRCRSNGLTKATLDYFNKSHDLNTKTGLFYLSNVIL